MPTYTDNTTFPVELRSIGELYLANDETSGGAADASGNGRNFTASTAAPGSAGGLRTFSSAANNYLQLTPIPSALHIGSGPWYLHAKARFTGAGDQCIISAWDDSDGEQEFVIQFSNGNKVLFIASPNGTAVPTFPIADASANTLHSIECWSDGAGISISVDGATSVGIGTTHPIHASTAPMRFGQLSNGSNKLNGAVGAVYMAKGALPSTGARAYLRAGSNPYAQAAGDTTKPTFTSATVNAAGNLLTLAASENVTGVTASALSLQGHFAHALSALAGSGSSYTLAISPPLQKGEAVELVYTGTAIQDTATTPNVMDAFRLRVTNGSTVPPSDSRLAAATNLAITVMLANEVTVGGLETHYPGPVYDIVAAVDLWLSMIASPELYTATDVKNAVVIFSSRLNTDGLIANYVLQNGTPLYWGGNESNPPHIVGDSAWIIPLLIKEYYRRTGDISLYNTYKVAVRATMGAISTDGGTGLVYVDPAAPWTPMGFQDGFDKKGNDAYGSGLKWKGLEAAISLAAVANDTTNASYYSTAKSAIAANITSLFITGTGMFRSCSVAPNNVVDIHASIFIAWTGLATTGQKAAIVGYIVANPSLVFDSHGFIAQSIANWPSGPRLLDGHGGPGSYDDGFWAYLWFFLMSILIEAADAGNAAAGALATTMFATYQAGTDPTQEWYRRAGGTGDAIGSTNYLATVGQSVGAARLLANYVVTPVATPTFSPVAGTVASGTLITFSSTTSGATFYSTIDGSTPTTASTAGATRTVSAGQTIKVLAVKAGLTDSAVASATYTILAPGTVATPTFSPVGGNYTGDRVITISCSTSAVSIYYTTDGSTPTTASTPYSSAITITTGTTVIKALAVKGGLTDSAVGTGTYIISASGGGGNLYPEYDNEAVSIAIEAPPKTAFYLTGVEILSVLISGQGLGFPFNFIQSDVQIGFTAAGASSPPDTSTLITGSLRPVDGKVQARWFVGDSSTGDLPEIILEAGTYKPWLLFDYGPEISWYAEMPNIIIRGESS